MKATSSQTATSRSLLLHSPSQKTKALHVSPTARCHRGRFQVMAIKDGEALDRPLRVAVVGGGPAGACCAEVLAANGIETYLFERKLDNCKPCGGAIPTCMVGEFDLPESIIDRKVTKMNMISPSNRQTYIELTAENEYIGMCRREVLDKYLRDRATKNGTKVINGLVKTVQIPKSDEDPLNLVYSNYESAEGKGRVGETAELEVDIVVGADGANSKVAKSMGAGDYDYAIAFQERIRIADDKMEFYKELAEMYVGDDVSPDFYGWVFPKYDHVAVGTGTVMNKTAIKDYQEATRIRSKFKTGAGELLRIEAHPIPEHPRPQRIKGRVTLVGDAAGYVTKCSGEGIYFAAKSGRMCAEAIVEQSQKGKRMIGEAALRIYLNKFDKQYWGTYKVLDILQKVFYRSNPSREAFIELCTDKYIQKMTFDSYLYKTIVPGNPIEDFKLLLKTVSCLIRANALGQPQNASV